MDTMLGRRFISTTVHEGVDVARFCYEIVAEPDDEGVAKMVMVWQDQPDRPELGRIVSHRREGVGVVHNIRVAGIPTDHSYERSNWVDEYVCGPCRKGKHPKCLGGLSDQECHCEVEHG